MPPLIVEFTVSDPIRTKTDTLTKFPLGAAAMVAAHPVRKVITQDTRPQTRLSLGTEIPAPRVYTIEALGYSIREHKIRSRLESQSSNDGSDDERQTRQYGMTHLKYVIYELRVTSWKGLKCTQKTIFRRYHDFEELNEMLPANIAQAARLPGRRYWARLTGSRFTKKTIEERQHEVVRYLERLLAMVPDYEAVQMFICDDWLSRDTPCRRRQFMRVVAHQHRLKQLIAARAQVEGWGEVMRSVTEAPQRNRLYVPSSLGPNGKTAKRAWTLKPPTQLVPPPSPRLEDSSSSKSLGMVHMSHPRVRSIREEAWEVPRPVICTNPDKMHLSPGTPAAWKAANLPRAPLPADK